MSFYTDLSLIHIFQVNGEKQGVEVFALGDKISPVEIAQRAVEYAKANGFNTVMLDTAGRLHVDEDIDVYKRQVFTGANLTRADFRGAKDYVISPQDNRVRRAKFSFPEVMSLLRCLEIEIE